MLSCPVMSGWTAPMWESQGLFVSFWFGAQNSACSGRPPWLQGRSSQTSKIDEPAVGTVVRQKRNSSQEGPCMPKRNTPILSSALSWSLPSPLCWKRTPLCRCSSGWSCGEALNTCCGSAGVVRSRSGSLGLGLQELSMEQGLQC